MLSSEKLHVSNKSPVVMHYVLVIHHLLECQNKKWITEHNIEVSVCLYSAAEESKVQ